jgi:hypothetical protein
MVTIHLAISSPDSYLSWRGNHQMHLRRQPVGQTMKRMAISTCQNYKCRFLQLQPRLASLPGNIRSLVVAFAEARLLCIELCRWFHLDRLLGCDRQSRTVIAQVARHFSMSTFIIGTTCSWEIREKLLRRRRSMRLPSLSPTKSTLRSRRSNAGHPYCPSRPHTALRRDPMRPRCGGWASQLRG